MRRTVAAALSKPQARCSGQELPLCEGTDTLHDPYRPAAFTLFPDLTIHAEFNGYWYWGRATMEELRQEMRAIAREIREDWEVPES